MRLYFFFLGGGGVLSNILKHNYLKYAFFKKYIFTYFFFLSSAECFFTFGLGFFFLLQLFDLCSSEARRQDMKFILYFQLYIKAKVNVAPFSLQSIKICEYFHNHLHIYEIKPIKYQKLTILIQ